MIPVPSGTRVWLAARAGHTHIRLNERAAFRTEFDRPGYLNGGQHVLPDWCYTRGHLIFFFQS
jgi:hypothetical protein